MTKKVAPNIEFFNFELELPTVKLLYFRWRFAFRPFQERFVCARSNYHLVTLELDRRKPSKWLVKQNIIQFTKSTTKQRCMKLFLTLKKLEFNPALTLS